MRSSLKVALTGIMLLTGSVAIGRPAIAENVTVGVTSGGIAFGYDDGYWDRERQWHAWRNREEAAHWREENREHYYARRHDRDHERDHDDGWRDRDRWWERR